MVRQNAEVKRVTSPAPPEQLRPSPAPGPRRGLASAWGPLREPLFRALWIGAVAFNVARAVGPALGGLLVAAMGSGAVFLLNAASFLGVIAVLYRWRRDVGKSGLPPEHVIGAVRAGVRYVRHAPALQAVLVR